MRDNSAQYRSLRLLGIGVSSKMSTDYDFMKIALEEAEAAYRRGEVPVGAVLVREGNILARAHNSPIANNDPSAHAEMLVLRQAAEKIGNYRLAGTELYVTIGALHYVRGRHCSRAGGAGDFRSARSEMRRSGFII